LAYADYIFIFIFTFEFIIRSFAEGLFLTPNAYFKGPWNVLDFLIVGSMYLDTFYFGNSTGSQGT